jgi:two-component system nitrogen regulation sensor histidine kinase NtrY
VAQFAVPGSEKQRLIALQRIAGELDPVEVKAWQDMARVLAHEMMGSLTPIVSLAASLEHLLEKGDAAPEGKDEEIVGAVEAIRRRSEGLLSFVDRYREFSELPKPALKMFSAPDFVYAIGRFMKPSFEAKNISYEAECSLESEIVADRDLLEHAVINLLRNALDATDGVADPSVRLVCTRRGDQILIEIEDNGRGLPRENVEELFVPFFSTKPGGSGIGLSLARQIALAHGGILTASSRQPRGTKFSLQLPIPDSV